MNNFWKKQKQTLLVIGLPALAVVFIFFAVLPQKRKIAVQINDAQEIIARRQVMEKKISELGKMREQYDLIQENKGNIGILFSDENVVAVIELLEKIAAETENSITIEIGEKDKVLENKSVKKEEDKLTLKPAGEEYVAMKISLAGSYQNFRKFLAKIENEEYYADVMSIQISVKKPISLMNQGNSIANPFSSESISDTEEDLGEVPERKEPEVYSDLKILFYKEKK